MSIRTISTGQLRRMGDQEGLILQGCGGDPQEWLDGINEILAQECILKKGAGFEEAYCDRIVRDGKTCKQVAPRLKKRERDAAHLVTSEYERIKDMLFHRRDRMGGNKIASAIDLTDDELVQ